MSNAEKGQPSGRGVYDAKSASTYLRDLINLIKFGWINREAFRKMEGAGS